jgi:hypothetical protein
MQTSTHSIFLFIRNCISISQFFYDIDMQALRRQIAKYEWSKPKCDLATEYVGIVQNNVGIRAYGELESRAAHITWHQRHCSMAVCSCLGWRLAEDILRSWFVHEQAILVLEATSLYYAASDIAREKL